MDPCYLEPPKIISQLFGASKKRMTAILSQKTGLQLFGERKKWIPAIWKLKKLVHSYLQLEKLFRSLLEKEKRLSLLFRPKKMSCTNICSKKKEITAILGQKNGFEAIYRVKKVDHFYFEQQKCVSQLFGAGKKSMTAISSKKFLF